jgi:hypothetical protein
MIVKINVSLHTIHYTTPTMGSSTSSILYNDYGLYRMIDYKDYSTDMTTELLLMDREDVQALTRHGRLTNFTDLILDKNRTNYVFIYDDGWFVLVGNVIYTLESYLSRHWLDSFLTGTYSVIAHEGADGRVSYVYNFSSGDRWSELEFLGSMNEEEYLEFMQRGDVRASDDSSIEAAPRSGRIKQAPSLFHMLQRFGENPALQRMTMPVLYFYRDGGLKYSTLHQDYFE